MFVTWDNSLQEHCIWY